MNAVYTSEQRASGSTCPAPAALVLAAGAGRRLGCGPKALLQINGVPLIHSLTDALLSGGCSDITVVTGAQAEEVETAILDRPRVHVAHNPDWTAGMGSSLRCGLQAIGTDRNILVTPVDRPGINAAEVARIIAAHHPGRITAAAHRDPTGRLQRGHPVLFDAVWTAAAAASAHNDVGARELLLAHHDTVALLDCSDLDDGADIDIPADLCRLDAVTSGPVPVTRSRSVSGLSDAAKHSRG